MLRYTEAVADWVPAIFTEARPSLRSQVISHALVLGMGQIPVPIEAPEELAPQPHADGT